MMADQQKQDDGILTQLKDTALARLKGQITGPFILFLAAFNWRVLVYLFWENGDAAQRIRSIEELKIGFVSLFSYPLTATFCYAVILPLLHHIQTLYNGFFEQREAVIAAVEALDVSEIAEYGKVVRSMFNQQNQRERNVSSKIDGIISLVESVSQEIKNAARNPNYGSEILKQLRAAKAELETSKKQEEIGLNRHARFRFFIKNYFNRALGKIEPNKK